MLPSTETLDQALSDLKALPPHSCPDVDRMLKTLQSEERDASTAADDALNLSRREEDPIIAKAMEEASRSLEEASKAINEAAMALDHERDIASDLREGCDSRESIAKAAIQGCSDRDEMIAVLEEGKRDRDQLIENQREIIDLLKHQKEVSQRVINHLGAQIKASWLTKMANATKRLWWQRRARGMKKRIQQLGLDKSIMGARNRDLFDALLLADGILCEHEWESDPFGVRHCPSCHITDGGRLWGPIPKHEHGCRIGKACEVIRWALQNEARQQGVDPNTVGGQSREFQT